MLEKIFTPRRYRRWQKVLDHFFSKGLKNETQGGLPVVSFEEIRNTIQMSDEEIEEALLYLCRAGLLEHTGNTGVHEYSLTPNGQVASFEKSLSRKGSDNRYKNVQVFYTFLLIIGTITNMYFLFVNTSDKDLESSVFILKREIRKLNSQLDSIEANSLRLKAIDMKVDSSMNETPINQNRPHKINFTNP